MGMLMRRRAPKQAKTVTEKPVEEPKKAPTKKPVKKG